MPNTPPGFLLLSCALLAARAGIAQSTWTVAASGGAQFTTIAAAVQAANHGDTILVAPGTYTLGFTLTKGVAIVGAGGTPLLVGELTVTLASGRTASIVDFASAPSGSPFRLRAYLSAGTLHGEALTLSRPAAWETGLHMDNAASVTLRRCSVYGSPPVYGMVSTIACAESTLSGVGSYALFGDGASAMDAHGSTVELIGCTLLAGDAAVHQQPAFGGTALRALSGTRVRAANSSFVAGTAPSWGTGGHSAHVDAASVLVHDPRCILGHGLSGTGVVTSVPMCDLAGTPAPSGGQATFTASGPAGAIAIVAAALPAMPFPSPHGRLWLDPATTSVLQFGALPLPPIVLAIPAGIPRGTPFALQTGLVVSGAVHVAPPLVPVVR